MATESSSHRVVYGCGVGSRGTGAHRAGDIARQAVYRQAVLRRRDPSRLRCFATALASLSTTSTGHRRKTRLPRWEQRHSACPGGRPSSELSSETVENIGRGNVASVRASPYRRRVIGPCAAPVSSVGGLAGSPKCIRACWLSLRRSCHQSTLCKDLVAASAAPSA